MTAVIIGSTLLTACNDDSDTSSDGAGSSASSSSPSAPYDTAAPESSAPAAPDGGNSGSAGKKVAVNKSFEDTLMGDKGTVVEYVSGYQPSAASKSKFSALEDEDVVLVHVKVTAGSKYYTTLGATSFRLTGTENGIDQASTTILDDEIKAAGYPPLEDAETGKSSDGWLVFTPDKGLEKLVLRYKRLAATTSDGQSIPAKNFDIPLN